MQKCLVHYFGVASALSAWLWVGAVRAQAELEPVTLSYRAPPQCPSRAEFLTEVQRSAPRMRLAGEGAPTPRRFEVSVTDDGLLGKLSIDGGSAGFREVRGADCAEVSRLLAFATALAADPDAAPKDNVAGPTQAAPVERSVPAPVRARPAAPSAARHSALGGSAGAFGSVEGASAPSPSFGGGLFGEAQLRSSALRPLLRLGVGYAKSADARPIEGGRVSFSDTFALLDVCPVRFESGRWALAPCARFEGVRTTASASRDVPFGHTVHPFQLDLGVLGRVRVRLGGPLFVELGGGALFPVLRPAVYLNGVQRRVHDVPYVAAVGELSLGIEFR